MTLQSMVGQIVRAPKTAELIARHVRGQIVRGDLQAGDTLPPENDLMQQFGVSRPTLREAFRILETESLIHIRRGSRGGAQVTAPEMTVAARYVGLLLQMQHTTVGDLYEARGVVEPTCARLFAQRRTKRLLAELRAAVEAVRAAFDEGMDDGIHVATLTYRVHEVVMRGSGNKTLAVQGGVLQDIVATHMATTVDQDTGASRRGRYRRLLRSYDKLIGFIEAGDGEAAEKHWRKHMEAVANSLLGDAGPKVVVDLFSAF